MGTSKAGEILLQKRAIFRNEAEKALSTLGISHPASRHLTSVLRALDHRPPTKREKALVHAVVTPPQQTAGQKPWKEATSSPTSWEALDPIPWAALCIRCHERSSEVLSIILGFPVCDSCHAMFEEGFRNLVSTDLDVELYDPRMPSRDLDPMGTAGEEMDLDI